MKDEDALQKIFWNIEHVGTPSNIIFKLLEKADSPDFDIGEMTSLVEKDATVAALIMKTANSVHFARGNRITTLKHAIVHLGTLNVRRLLFAIEMLGIFRARHSSKQFSEVEFWSHTLAGALLASKYAALKKSCDPDVAYIAGLLRNIGVLAIRQFTPHEFEQMLLLQHAERASFERLSDFVLGTSHREITYMIGLQWDLPRSIISSIKNTIDPSDITDEIKAIREAILFADELLHDAHYCVWDTYYMPGNFDFHGIPAESMFNETKELVEIMMKEFWNQ